MILGLFAGLNWLAVLVECVGNTLEELLRGLQIFH